MFRSTSERPVLILLVIILIAVVYPAVDPSFRVIPSDAPQEQVEVAHLHINGADIKEDLDVVLPIRTFRTLESEGVIGELADEHYSFMGYQERALAGWRETYGPELAKRLNEQAVDVLLLAPA